MFLQGAMTGRLCLREKVTMKDTWKKIGTATIKGKGEKDKGSIL
jgi:hypothetical protein